MARFDMLIPLALALLAVFPPYTVSENVTYAGISQSSKQLYFKSQTRNYTVTPYLESGILEILQLHLFDMGWVILFTQSYEERLSRRTPCPQEFSEISRDDIVKVYDVTTKIAKDGPPQSFQIPSGTILCIMRLKYSTLRRDEDRYSSREKIVYTYKDANNPSVGEVQFESRDSYRRSFERGVRVQAYTKEKCFRMQYRKNMAIEVIGRMNDKMSLNDVRVTYGPRSTRDSYRQPYRVLTLTGRTPDSAYRRVYTAPWYGWYGYSDNQLCFFYDVINGTKEDFNDNVWFRVTAFPTCSGNMTATSGVFATYGYPEYMSSSYRDCTVNISAKQGQRISLKFIDADVDCSGSYVMLRGVRQSPNNMMLLCGAASMEGKEYTSKANSLSLHFRKRRRAGKNGYAAKYTVIGCSLPDADLPANSTILNENVEFMPPGFKLRVGCKPGYVFPTWKSEASLKCNANNTWDGGVPLCVEYRVCGESLNAPTGVIQSPGYPNPSPKDTSCEWTITAKPGQSIRFTVQDISANCTDNYLHLYRAVADRSSSARERGQLLCDDSAVNGLTFYTMTNRLSVRFNSNFMKDSGYFKASYEATGCSTESPVLAKRYRFLPQGKRVFPFGSKLTFICPVYYNRRYFATGEEKLTATCGEDGEWKGRFPLCMPL